MTDDTVHDRLDRLESLVEQQQGTIQEQRDHIEELSAKQSADSSEFLVADGGDVKVVGDMPADNGTGVRGHATATGTSETTGVEGTADADADNNSSPEVIPAGVRGETTGDGSTHGVRGDTASVNGRGVTGFATSDAYNHSSFTQSGIGVIGVTDRSGDDSGISDAGGVFGYATASEGTAYGVIGRTNSPDGWGVRGMDMSGSGHGVYSYGDSKTQGDHETTGDTELGGELAFGDETPQRTAGPIAKGWINSDGSIENAVNVSNAYWNDSEERYRITISGETYWYNSYATVVTPLSHATVRTTSNGGDLVVEFRDLGDALVKRGFQFVTYDLPTGDVETTAASDESTRLEESEPDEPRGAASTR